MKYDLIVLGAGPGGFDAAVHAASLGLNTALVERDALGGTCLNVGCIPTKLMLGATDSGHELAAQAKVKAAEGEIRFNWPAVMSKKSKVLAGSRKAMVMRLKDLGVDLIQGTARIAGSDRIKVDTADGFTDLEFTKLIIATGSRPSWFPGVEPDDESVLDSTGFLNLTEAPKSLMVLGGGFIGLEMAQAAHRFGADITVLDAMDRVAPAEDPEVSKMLASQFKRQKWKIKLGVRAKSMVTRDGKAVLTLDTGEEFEAEKGLVAVGRRPNTDTLNLEAVGIETGPGGYIQTDDHLMVTENILAIGDVNGRAMLAHAASHQATYVARLLAGKETGPYVSGPIPSILYGAPEALRVGASEAEVRETGECKISRAQLAANPIAQAHSAAQGFIKAVWDGDKLAGITAVGRDVSRFAVAASIMVSQGWTAEQAQALMFPHPTLDEAMLSALVAPKE